MRNIRTELVSVMVPAYNQEEYILDCLNSIFHQTYSEIELLIANDCSTDRTFELITKWVDEHRHRFVKCIIINNVTNIGISRNFNSLLEHANGHYLKILAGDDILMPEAIGRGIEYFHKNKSADIVYGNAYLIGRDDRYPLEKTKSFKLFFDKPPGYKDNIAEALFRADVIPAPAVFLKDSTIKKFGLYREDLAFEDWEYWLRVAANGGKICYLDCPVVGYRILETSASHYTSGNEEEIRYNKIIDSEVRLLNDYMDKVKDGSMDSYWNRTLKFCIDREYKTTVKDILQNRKFELEPITFFMLISYRLHIYKLSKKIWMCIKYRKQ